MNYYNYFTEIEETFIRRRAKNLLLSPLDWALMEVWQERGIPLHVVIRAIEQVFDNFEKKPGPRTIKGLMFCREEVEAQYDEWLKGQAGRSPDEIASPAMEQSPQEIAEHIVGLIASLRRNSAPTLSDDIERACLRLEEIAANVTTDTELLDKSLSDVEDLLDAALLEKSDRERFSSLSNEVTAQMRPYRSSMDEDAYKNTFRLMLLKRLREEEGIPRLSLFYL
ncbi:MAG: hypothetical protein JNJ39_11920 [Blastocatellia bacterium]|nr:hypothetical protein [Blastocatellia bacterium]